MTTRPRWVYALAVAGTIVVGLASRAIHGIPKGVGDALYATMVVFGLCVIAPRLRWWVTCAIAMAFCTAIELTQRIHVPWLDAVRRTFLGHMILGQGFNALDLVDYAIGVALGAAVRWLLDGAGRSLARPHDGG